MLQVDVFSLAAAITALLLAAGLLVAWAINRRLTAFRWWAGSFVLLAIWLATATLRLEWSPVAVKWLSWGSFFAAAALVAHGLHREGATRHSPLLRILVCGALFLAIATTLSLVGAPQPYWMLLGPVATLVFMAWSGVLMLRAGAWGYGMTLYLGMTVIVVRALWHPAGLARGFGPPPPRPTLRGGLGPEAGPGAPIPLDPRPPAQGFIDFTPPPGMRPPVEHALGMTLITIVALLALAGALVLRDILAELHRMRERSTTDAMTGLLNRATFEERAAGLLASSGTRPISLVLFDIDHFKRINDTAGHAAGDRVIAHLGQLLGEMTVLQALAGRIGGEEFAVILPGSDLNTARLFAEAIRTGLAAAPRDEVIDWAVTASAGLAHYRPGESLGSLAARADKALYAAKAAGRDRVIAETTTDLVLREVG